MKKSVIIILFILLVGNSLYSGNIFNIPQIVVTDRKINDETAFTKTVIKVKHKKLEEKTLSDILDNQPGIHVTTLAGRGSYSVVSIRGSTSAQVLVYIDGILVNSGGTSSVDLSSIPVEQIDKIEIYRGNIPAKFGRGGIGGVINIITKKDIKALSNLSTSIGSWKFFNIEGNFKYKHLFSNLSYESRTGDYPYLNDANTPFNKKDDYHAHRKNNYYNQKNLLFNYKLPIKDNIISTTYRHFYKYRDLPGVAPGRDKPTTLTDAILRTKKNHFDISYSTLIQKGILSFQPFFDKSKKSFYNPKYKLGMYGLLKSKYISSKYGCNISYELNLNHIVNLGIYNENRYEILRTYITPESNWLSNRKYKRIEHSFTIQNDFKFLKKSFIISPVYRKNILKDKDKKNNSTDFFSKDTYSIGIKVIPYFFKNFYLKYNYGHFVRFPDFYEKFGDGATIIPNTKLTYEKSKNIDYGFGFTSKFLNFNLTFFKNKIKNLIEFIMINERYSMYKNIEDADIKGYEADISFNIYNIFLFSANYTTLDSKSKQSGYKEDKPLPNRPEHKTYVRFQTNLGKFSLWTEYNEIGKNYFDDGGHYYYNTYDFANLGLIYKPKKNILLSITIKNLTNNQDMYAYSKGFNIAKLPYYPVEGRHFYFKINYNF